MNFCDECGSMMHTAGETWVCRACGNEVARDSRAETAMTTHEGQQDDGAPAIADATQGADETVHKPCPAAGCDSETAESATMPKPGGAYEVRLFTCTACGHSWRES